MIRYAVLSAALVAVVSGAAFADEATMDHSQHQKQAQMGGAKKTDAFLEFMPDTLKWGPAPSGLPEGAQGAMLEGDPSKAGQFFAVRLKTPAGYKIMPHSHLAPERVTVLEGTLYLGMGETWDDAAFKAYPAGSYVSIPKGHTHFAMFKDATVLQLASIGPWDIKYVDPKNDPRRASKGR